MLLSQLRFALFTAVFVWTIKPLSSGLHCNEPRSCLSSSIISTNSTSIECNGFYSCGNVMSLQTTSGASILCRGSFSCFNATSIEILNPIKNSTNIIECSGFKSCSNTHSITNKNGTIDCAAELSCSDSTAIASNTLLCRGDRACQNSAIFSDSVSFTGYLAGYNTTIQNINDNNNSNINTTSYLFSGKESGFGATVICSQGSTCNIICDGDACNNLTLRCGNGTSDACIFHVTCWHAFRSDICPNGTEIGSINTDISELGSLIATGVLHTSDIDDPCYSSIDTNTNTNTSDAVQCDGNLECSSDLILTLDQSICCSGASSCDSSFYLSAAIGIKNVSVGIRCDGYRSCYSVVNGISTITYGNLYFGGFEACSYVLDIGNLLQIVGGYNGNRNSIFCGGTDSCKYKNLKQASNVYCNGEGSCGNSFFEIIGNVWAYGFNSARKSIMVNIYCGAGYSCYGSYFLNVDGNIYVFGMEGMGQSYVYNIINNGNVNVYVLGYKGIGDSVIENVDSVSFSSLFYFVVRFAGDVVFVFLFAFFCTIAANKTKTGIL